MRKISYKIRIVLILGVFGLIAGGMFTTGYDILAGRNQSLADSASQWRLEHDVLVREQQAVEKGKKDLEELNSKPYPPDNLFSQDTKLVKEIQLMEAIATSYNVDLSLSVSGTVKTAVKVPGVTNDLVVVPYTVTLRGPFEDLIKYLQQSEHLPFVSYDKVVSITAIPGGKSSMVINSDFYIKR